MFSLFQQYTSGWAQGNKEQIISCLTSDCVITECNGQRFKGLDQINSWLNDWEQAGNEVTQWKIKSDYYDLKSKTAVFEWDFTCLVEGNQYHFKGVSVVGYESKRIKEMKEYRMEAELCFPYEEES
jgi:hypothetical protein